MKTLFATALFGLAAAAVAQTSSIVAPSTSGPAPLAKPRLHQHPDAVRAVESYRISTLRDPWSARFPDPLDFSRIIRHPKHKPALEPFKPSGHNEAPAFEDQAQLDTMAPDLITDFAGPADGSWIPPDNAMAVADDYIVAAVNDNFTIYDKCGNQLSSQDMNTVMGTSFKYYDPRVIFDPWNSRFVMLWLVQNTATSLSRILIMASDNPNPNGEWFTYQWNASTGSGAGQTWADYYDLGYGEEALYASGNQHKFSNNDWTESRCWTFDKGEIYADFRPSSAIIRSGLDDRNGDAQMWPRSAKMQVVYDGIDGVFVNSKLFGGDEITLWTLEDPLGSRVFTRQHVNISDYDTPPKADQPGGVGVDTPRDCRLFEVVVSGNENASIVRMYTSLMDRHRWNGDNVDHIAARLLVLNPQTEDVVFESTFGQSGMDYFFPAVGADYGPSCFWSFARSGPGAGDFLSYRFVDWNRGAFSASSRGIKTGSVVYDPTGDNRWGDYFCTAPDWADYGHTDDGQMKLWMFGEYPISSTSEGNWIGAAANDASTGTMKVTPSAVQYRSKVKGLAGLPSSVVYDLENLGGLSYAWEITSLPSWLNASDEYDEVAGKLTDTVTLSFNDNVFDLEPGTYRGVVTFENCFTGGEVSRTIELTVLGIVRGSRF